MYSERIRNAMINKRIALGRSLQRGAYLFRVNRTRDTELKMTKRDDDRLTRVERMTLRMSLIQTFIAVTGFVGDRPLNAT